MDLDALLARHAELTEALADAYRNQAMHAQAETQAKVASYQASVGHSGTDREMIAKGVAATYTTQRIHYDAEVKAYEALVAHVALAVSVALSRQ